MFVVILLLFQVVESVTVLVGDCDSHLLTHGNNVLVPNLKHLILKRVDSDWIFEHIK